MSSPREREKRDRRDESEGQGKKRNKNESEETEETRAVGGQRARLLGTFYIVTFLSLSHII